MMRTRTLKFALLLLGAVIVALVFAAYLRASFMLDLASRLLVCL